MDLTVLERLTLLNLLPGEGDVVTLKMVRDLQNDLGLSAEELEKYEVVQEGGRVRWKTDVAGSKEVDFPTAAMDLIKDLLRKAADSKKLTVPQLGLYERFIEGKEEKDAGSEGSAGSGRSGRPRREHPQPIRGG